jgi:hypothetical protein
VRREREHLRHWRHREVRKPLVASKAVNGYGSSVRPIPRVALRVPDEAAATLGVSPDFFDEHVRHEVRLIRRGRLVLVSLRELERWATENAERPLWEQAA